MALMLDLKPFETFRNLLKPFETYRNMKLIEKAWEAVRLYIKIRKEKKRESVLASLVMQSNELFQIVEYNGDMWLTFEARLVIPCAMLKDTPIDALRKIRACYVARKSRK